MKAAINVLQDKANSLRRLIESQGHEIDELTTRLIELREARRASAGALADIKATLEKLKA